MTAQPNDPRRDAWRSAAIVVGWHAQASYVETASMQLISLDADGTSWRFTDGRTVDLPATGGKACPTDAARRLQGSGADKLTLAALTQARNPARSAALTLAPLGRYVGAADSSTTLALPRLFDEHARDRLGVLVDFARGQRLRAAAFHALVCQHRLDPIDDVRRLTWSQAPDSGALRQWRWLSAPVSDDEPVFHTAGRVPIRIPGQPRHPYTANHWRSWLKHTAELLYPHDAALPAVDGCGWWQRHTQEPHP